MMNTNEIVKKGVGLLQKGEVKWGKVVVLDYF